MANVSFYKGQVNSTGHPLGALGFSVGSRNISLVYAEGRSGIVCYSKYSGDIQIYRTNILVQLHETGFERILKKAQSDSLSGVGYMKYNNVSICDEVPSVLDLSVSRVQSTINVCSPAHFSGYGNFYNVITQIMGVPTGATIKLYWDNGILKFSASGGTYTVDLENAVSTFICSSDQCLFTLESADGMFELQAALPASTISQYVSVSTNSTKLDDVHSTTA